MERGETREVLHINDVHPVANAYAVGAKCGDDRHVRVGRDEADSKFGLRKVEVKFLEEIRIEPP